MFFSRFSFGFRPLFSRRGFLFWELFSLFISIIEMIILHRNTTASVVLTLTEKQLLASPNYLFLFEHRTTKDVIRFVKLNATDTSSYKDRFNRFSFVVDTLFPNADRGLYSYSVYETSGTGTDETGLNLLEVGLMELIDEEEIFTQPNSRSNFVTP